MNLGVYDVERNLLGQVEVPNRCVQIVTRSLLVDKACQCHFNEKISRTR